MMIERNNDDELYDGLKNVRDMHGKSHGNFLELNNEEIEKFRLMNAKLFRRILIIYNTVYNAV